MAKIILNSTDHEQIACGPWWSIIFAHIACRGHIKPGSRGKNRR